MRPGTAFVLGLACGALFIAGGGVWLAQDRAIVRAASETPLYAGTTSSNGSTHERPGSPEPILKITRVAPTAPHPRTFPFAHSVAFARLNRSLCRIAHTMESESPLFDDCAWRGERVADARVQTR